MTRLVILTLGAALATVACGAASDSTGTKPSSETGAAAGAAIAANRPGYRAVTIPGGTTLPLSLTGSIASDTSAVEDAVTAELTGPISVDGREVLPAGTRLTGVVTAVDKSEKVKGRAMIAFRFTSLRTGDFRYDLESRPLSHMAPATKGEDATTIGVGAGAGALIGGILGGKKGAGEGAAVGGGAGTAVVLATKGPEVRLGPGADVTTQLTAPLTVRVGRH